MKRASKRASSALRDSRAMVGLRSSTRRSRLFWRAKRRHSSIVSWTCAGAVEGRDAAPGREEGREAAAGSKLLICWSFSRRTTISPVPPLPAESKQPEQRIASAREQMARVKIRGRVRFIWPLELWSKTQNRCSAQRNLRDCGGKNAPLLLIRSG